MTRSPLTFKGTDLKRAINSALEAGLQISHFEITKAGSIVVHVADSNQESEGNPWDGALNGKRR